MDILPTTHQGTVREKPKPPLHIGSHNRNAPKSLQKKQKPKLETQNPFQI